MTNPNPPVTPFIVFDDAEAAIALYKEAFGAIELFRMPAPDGSGKLVYAEISIRDTKLMVSPPCDENMRPGGTSVGFYVYYDNLEEAFSQAQKSKGLKVLMPVQDMPWGDKMCSFQDKFGITWSLAQHMHEVSPEEIQEKMQEMMKNKPST